VVVLSAAPAATTATELLRLRVSAGAGIGDTRGLSERARRAVAVAERTGAPVLAALDGALAAEDDAARARRAVTVASAQARAVATGLIAAPVLLVPGLGRLANADLRAFAASPLGAVVIAVGGGLLAIGALVIVGLIRRVSRPPRAHGPAGAGALLAATVVAAVAWRVAGPLLVPVAALVAHRLVARRAVRHVAPPGVDEAVDLTATALGGGVSPAEALRVVARAHPDLAVPLRRLAFDLELGLAVAGGPPPARDGAPRGARVRAGHRAEPYDDGAEPLRRLATVLLAADAVGAPAVPALRRLGADLRAEDLARVLAAAERLPAQLTFPTALCLLPATVLLVGAPIVQTGLAGFGT
jgi:hypothetical protein